jgi:hypothetical protein
MPRMMREAAGFEAKLSIPSLEITAGLSEIFSNAGFARSAFKPPTFRRV